MVFIRHRKKCDILNLNYILETLYFYTKLDRVGDVLPRYMNDVSISAARAGYAHAYMQYLDIFAEYLVPISLT